MKLYYFREFQEITPPGETEKVRLSEITLLERLAFSAYFTALKSNKKSIDFEEIIFGDNVSRGNLEDTVRMLSHLLKTRVNVCHWIKQNFDKVNKDGNSIIHTIEINTDNIFTTRLGKTQKSIDNVAFRAFVLASAKSRCKGKNPLLDTIPIHNWIDSSISTLREADEKVKNNVIYNAPRIRRYIQMWLDSTGVEAHFKDKMTLVIDGMKQKSQKTDKVKEHTEPKKLFDSIEQQKKPKAEPVEPVKEDEKKSDFQKFCEKNIGKDFNLESMKWANRYDALKADDPKIAMKCIKEYDIQKAIEKVARTYGTDYESIQKKFKYDGYLRNEVQKENNLYLNYEGVKNELITIVHNIKDEDDCIADKRLKDALIGFGYETYPWLMKLDF